MAYRILSLLGLQDLLVFSVLEYASQIFLYVLPRKKTAYCPICNFRSKAVHENRPPQIIKHYKLGRRQIFLVLFKRRFFCHFCSKPFTESCSLLSGKWQRKTKGLEEEIINSLKESSFLGVKRKFGVSYVSQTKLLKKVLKPFEGNWEKEENSSSQISLGIDEHSFSGHDMVLTITNLAPPD